MSRAVRGLQCPSHTGPPQRHCRRGRPVWWTVPFLATSVNATKIVGVDKCRTTGHSATKRTAVSEPCNHHNKRARQGAYNFTLMQRITRRMSSPLLFHNRQIIMATGGSFDKPVQRAIRGKVSYQIGPTATQPLIRSSSQLTSLLRPSILTITNDSWQHRHHVAMREQDGGNGESRKPGVSRRDTCSASCDSADFSIQIVSEEFVGKVRSLNYPECVSCPTFPEDHHAASPHDLCCAIGRTEKWLTCLVLEYEDACRNPQGGSAYASRHSLTVREERAYFTTCSQVGVGDNAVGSPDTDEFARGCSYRLFSLSLTRKNTYEAVSPLRERPLQSK